MSDYYLLKKGSAPWSKTVKPEEKITWET